MTEKVIFTQIASSCNFSFALSNIKADKILEKLCSAQAQIKNLSNENLKLNEANRDYQEKNQKLKAVLDENEECLRELPRLTELFSEKEKIQEELTQKIKDISQLTAEVASKDSEITRLKEDNQKLEDQVKELP